MPTHEQISNAEKAATEFLDRHQLWRWVCHCATCQHLGKQSNAREEFQQPPLSYLPMLSIDASGRCQHCAAAATDSQAR